MDAIHPKNGRPPRSNHPSHPEIDIRFFFPLQNGSLRLVNQSILFTKATGYQLLYSDTWHSYRRLVWPPNPSSKKYFILNCGGAQACFTLPSPHLLNLCSSFRSKPREYLHKIFERGRLLNHLLIPPPLNLQNSSSFNRAHQLVLRLQRLCGSLHLETWPPPPAQQPWHFFAWQVTLFWFGGQRHCFGLWIVELSQNLHGHVGHTWSIGISLPFHTTMSHNDQLEIVISGRNLDSSMPLWEHVRRSRQFQTFPGIPRSELFARTTDRHVVAPQSVGAVDAENHLLKTKTSAVHLVLWNDSKRYCDPKLPNKGFEPMATDIYKKWMIDVDSLSNHT